MGEVRHETVSVSKCRHRGSANQPFKQLTGQLPARVEDRHDMDPIDVVSTDNPPWLFDQFPIGEDIHRSRLGNDAAAYRQCGKGLATPLQSRGCCEGIRRILLGNELDDSSRSSLAASVHRT